MTMKKFSSRKFLISLAAFLGSIGASISGIVTDNETVTIMGAVCTVLSAAIYADCEAYVEGKVVEKEGAAENTSDNESDRESDKEEGDSSTS